MNFRSPYQKLAGVMYLARFIDKARFNLKVGLPRDYAIAFCSPHGVDGHFLEHFGLGKKDFLEIVSQCDSDDGVVEWFQNQPSVCHATLESWNKLAPNLGKPGYPMNRIFRITLKRLGWDKGGLLSEEDGVFEGIVKDEGL